MWPISDSQKSKIFPVVTVVLILINVLFFVFQYLQSDLELFLQSYALIPTELIANGEWLTLVTSMFIHGGALHLFSNMWYLWVFGDNVEAKMGSGKYLLFYLVAGLVAALVQLGISWDTNVAIIGASGAISGVLGYYAVAFPQSKIKSFIIAYPRVGIYDISAKYLLAFWFALQFLNSLLSYSNGEGGVAWGAHVGGFLFGAGIAWLGKAMGGQVVPKK
ncbi:MAG: rhomboid family intramembrane serine protease [Candidatus Dojkabacteria bacterium]|nr:MAG: rhomboid family intramembrane serine protease [Candidatus Dojkabacteria bacterium]